MDKRFGLYRAPSETGGSGPKPPAGVDQVVEALAKELRPQKIILFGSAAKGGSTQGSDLDLLVVMNQVDSVHKRIVQGYKAIARLGLPVDLLVVSQNDVDEWGHVVGHVINEALVDGRILYDAA